VKQGKPVKYLLALVFIAFTCGLIAAALLGQALIIMGDEEPLGIVLVVLGLAAGLVFVGQWLVGAAEKRHANFSREK